MTGSQPAGSTTKTSLASPTGSTSDYLSQGLNLAGNVYNNTGGSTYSSLNGDQTSALNEIARTANQPNTNLWGALGSNQNIINGTALANNPATAGLTSIAGGSQNTTGLQNILTTLGGSANNAPNVGYLSDVMGGKYLDPSTNPWLKSTYDQGFSNVQNSVTSAMAGAGRFGSGAQAGALTSGASNLANSIYGTAYANERQLQDAAAKTLGSQYQTGVGLGISGAADAGQLATGDRSAALTALGQMGQNYNTGVSQQLQAQSLFPALNEARYADMTHLLAAGNSFQQDQNAQIGGAWGGIQNYMNAAKGLPTGTSSSQTTPFFDNATADAIAGAGGITSLLAQMFGGTGAAAAGPSLASQLGSGASSMWSKLFGNSGGAAADPAASNYISTYGQAAYDQLLNSGQGVPLSGVMPA